MQPDKSRLDELHGAAEQMGLQLSDNQVRQLLGHLDLLAKWNKSFNLTAIREPTDMLRQHLLDSLAVVPALCRSTSRTARKIVDVGSGAGFPGLSLASALPEATIVCVDSVGKKVGFLRQVIAELGIVNASAEHARIETLTDLNADVVTSRAFASLADFTALTRKHLSPSGIWMAMKGKSPDQEMALLTSDVEVFHVEQLTVPGLQSERCLVWMRPVLHSA